MNSEENNGVVLVVLDGLGVAPPSKGNAVTLAKTPQLDQYWPKYPHSYLQAAGTNVGLPHGVDGNSEVGHINIGAGKVVFQDLPRIDNAIGNGEFFKNEKLLTAMQTAKKNNSTLHIMGLVGAGEVHSSLSHLFALLKMAAEQGLEREQLLIHAFADGRDSPPKAAADVLDQIEAEMMRRKVGRLASLIGRYYAMDRDERWDRTQLAYDLIVQGQGKKMKHWQEALKDGYAQDKTDETLGAYVFPENKQTHQVNDGDAMIFFNFRPDRAIQLTKVFEQEDFSDFERKVYPDVYFVGMTDYEDDYPENVAFPPEIITQPLGKVISDAGLAQLRLAESEKFPHVTYFLNGGMEEVYPGEDRIEIPSPKDVATYDQKPEMSSYLITDMLVNKIRSKEYNFIACNYASADMVAHTGNLEASIRAIEILDECLGRVFEIAMDSGYTVVVTADHGNAEELLDLRSGDIDTKHSVNPVPLLIVRAGETGRELSVGNLADVAPTILEILDVEAPADMTGRNLLM